MSPLHVFPSCPHSLARPTKRQLCQLSLLMMSSEEWALYSRPSHPHLNSAFLWQTFSNSNLPFFCSNRVNLALNDAFLLPLSLSIHMCLIYICAFLYLLLYILKVIACHSFFFLSPFILRFHLPQDFQVSFLFGVCAWHSPWIFTNPQIFLSP